MLNININGQKEQIPTSYSLKDLLEQFNPENKPIAAAINGIFIPRSKYDTTPINEGDLIDLVSPVGGG